VTPSGGDDGEEGAAAAEEQGPVVNLDDYKGPLNEWIALESTRGEIKRRFRQFLLEFKGASTSRCRNARAAGCADSLSLLHARYLICFLLLC